ncbi:MAG: hypothetical protein ACR2HJ_05580 [Fimbriimonadales bacterium]
MSPESWDVPVTEDGRRSLIELVARYRASGQTRELGVCLARLAHCVKHVGTEDGADAFPASAGFGREAVDLLRQTGDKSELARALRVAAVPLVAGVHHKALLSESLAIAREIGDKEEEGWTLFRMTRADGVEGATVEQALACFEVCGSLAGKATCLVALGFERFATVSGADRRGRRALRTGW